MHDDRACQVEEKSGQAEERIEAWEIPARQVEVPRRCLGGCRSWSGTWQREVSKWRLTGILLVYEDVRSGKVK